MGRRRLCLIGPPPVLTFYRHMTLGFARALESHGLGESVIRDIDLETPLDEARARARQLARRKGRRTGW